MDKIIQDDYTGRVIDKRSFKLDPKNILKSSACMVATMN